MVNRDFIDTTYLSVYYNCLYAQGSLIDGKYIPECIYQRLDEGLMKAQAYIQVLYIIVRYKTHILLGKVLSWDTLFYMYALADAHHSQSTGTKHLDYRYQSKQEMAK